MFRYHTHNLPNGLKVAHWRHKSKVAYLAVIINSGTRDETSDKQGIAHFTEHMLFKGTGSRNTRQIIRCLEEVGGEVDAFTTKEDTVLFAAFPLKYFDRAAALFGEIVFNSVFPLKEIEKERDVIIDEINSYKDNPVELLFEEFDELVFKGHTLGKNILGTKKSLNSIKRNDILAFVKSNYVPSNIVVCSMGDIAFDSICTIVEKHFVAGLIEDKQKERVVFGGYNPVNIEKRKRAHQLHCVLGAVSYGYSDKRRIAFSLLINLLGGPAMLSRLNMLLRERYGLVYNIEANNTLYSDTGIFTIYFGADYKHYEKSLRLIQKELALFSSERISTVQLNQAKRQYIGQTLISLENPESLLMAMGKTLINNQGRFNEKSIIDQIQEISSEDILNSAHVLRPENLSMLVYS